MLVTNNNKKGEINMKQLIENLKAELQLREEQLEMHDKDPLDGQDSSFLKGMIYSLKTAIIFAEEGVDGQTIVRLADRAERQNVAYERKNRKNIRIGVITDEWLENNK